MTNPGRTTDNRAACLGPDEIAEIIQDWDDVGLLTKGESQVLGTRIAMSIQAAHDADEATQ